MQREGSACPSTGRTASSSAPTTSLRAKAARYPPPALGSGRYRRGPSAPQRLTNRRASWPSDLREREARPEAVPDGDAAPELAYGACTGCQHHRRPRIRRPGVVPGPVRRGWLTSTVRNTDLGNGSSPCCRRSASRWSSTSRSPGACRSPRTFSRTTTSTSSTKRCPRSSSGRC